MSINIQQLQPSIATHPGEILKDELDFRDTTQKEFALLTGIPQTHLNEIIKGNSAYKNTATWYLALSKLKQEDYDSCKSILLQIPNDYEDYDQVKILLDELKK